MSEPALDPQNDRVAALLKEYYRSDQWVRRSVIGCTTLAFVVMFGGFAVCVKAGDVGGLLVIVTVLSTTALLVTHAS